MEKKTVVGLDFGNFNSFASYISDIDAETRMGGIANDLIPPHLLEGIPSVYFYSERAGELCGEEAVRSKAKPEKNRLRYLKRHLGETIMLDDKEVSYDRAITKVIQHCIRRANKQLEARFLITTNLVSLSYPATYTCAQRQRLIELAEEATLEDGTKVEVFGTIAEPAAAALDYLAEFAKTDKDTTILTYDLGGGTFDLALVAAYPKGRKRQTGETYYYDIINARGISKLGGVEFDDVMYKLLAAKANTSLNNNESDALKKLAETTKVELSTSFDGLPQLAVGGEYVDLPVTREEFESASRGLLLQTIEETKKILQAHPNQQPEIILLTGGASQMPMVKNELVQSFPEYKGKIIYFRPSRAIAYGAARFGAAEGDDDVRSGMSIVQQRTIYDIGVRFYNSVDDKVGHIFTYISAGTPIPTNGKYYTSTTLHERQRFSRFSVYEANKSNPDEENVYQDYQEIMYVKLDHEDEVPVGR